MDALDERTRRLLNAVNGYCENGSFKIVEEGELLGAFPPAMGVDEKCLSAMLEYLKDHGFVEVSYAEGGEYCLRPLPAGRLYFEELKRARSEAFSRRLGAVLLALAGGFSGGFLGALSAFLIAAGG